MILRAVLKEALVSLYSAKQRSLLALIGIVIGIGSVIAMVTVSSIVREEALRQFKEMGTDILSISGEMMVGAGGAAVRAGGAQGVTPADLRRLHEAVPALLHHAPVVNLYGQGVRVGGRVVERVAVIATQPDLQRIAKLQLAEGRFLSALDGDGRHAVIGARLVERLGELGLGDQLLGAQIRIGDAFHTVVGVLAPAPFNPMAMFEPDNSVIIPVGLGLRMSGKNTIDTTLARVRPDVDNAAAAAQVRQFFMAAGKVVNVRSPDEIIAQMEKQMQMFTLLAGAIGSISLIVGGIGVMNVMLVSVTERRREIGVRRALGARRRDVQQQFLIESVILSLLGGVFGVLLGVGAAWGVAQLAGWPFMLSVEAIVLGVGVAAAVGIFFGYYPARQAARLDPIQALRAD